MRRLALVALFSCALVFSAGVHALGLGEIEMQSALNQRLDAEIPLRGVPADRSDSITVELASEEAFENLGMERPFSLTRLEFAVKQRDGGGYYVHVTSSRPIVEPFLSFLVEIEWPGGNLLREYTVLLDPPVFASEEQEETAGAQQAEPEGGAAGEQAAAPGDIERAAEPSDEADDDTSVQAEPADKAAAEEQAKRQVQREERKPVFLRIEEEEARAERAAADKARAAAEAKARAAEAEGAAASSSGPNQYGPVKRGESLWNIAARLKRGDMTVQQMMLALLRYNPDAFSANNINRLKEGYVLRVPDADEVTSVAAQRAIAQVKEQNAAWRQWRGDGRSGTAVAASEQAAGNGAATTDAGATGEEAELSIVGAEEGGASSDESASATGSSEASTSEKLKLTREQLESAQMEKQELASRVEELEQTVDKMEQLLSVRNERLNALQEELRRLEEKSGTEVAAAETGEDDQPAAGDDEAVAAADGGDGGDGDEAAGSGDGDVASTEPAGADGAAADGGDTGGEETATASAEDAGGEETTTSPAGDGGEETTTASAEASDGEETASAEAAAEATDDESSGDYVPEDKRATAADQGVETTRTQPSRETWLDTINNALGAVAGLFTGTGLGILTGPVGLGALAVVLLAVGGVVMMRRRRAAGEEPGADVDDMALETGSHTLAETEPEELPSAGGEADATERTDFGGGDAESALMNEEFDLGALDEDESARGVDRTQPAGGDTAADAEPDYEADKDDTVAEADVYLAYGLHKQAEDLLRLALKERPDDAPLYREKLLETLYAAGKTDEFVEEAGTFRDRVGSTTGRPWQRVLAMGREIAPDHALFAQGETQYTAADIAANRQAETDLELEGAGGDLDFALDEGGGQDDFGSTQAIDRTEAGGTVDGDAGLAGPDDDTATAHGGGGEADDLEFDLGDLDALDADERGRSREAEGASQAADEGELEFDLGDSDAEATSAGTSGSGGDDLDFDLDLGEDEGGDTAGGREASAETAGRGSDDDALEFDLDLDEEETGGSGAKASAGDAGESRGDDTEGLDFDLGDDAASASTKTGAGGDEGDGEGARSATAGAGGAETATDEGEDFLEIGDLDLEELDSESTGEGKAASSEATAAGDSGDDDEAFDLSDFDVGELEEGSGEEEQTAGGGATGEQTQTSVGRVEEFDLSDLDATAEGPASTGREEDEGDGGEPDLSDLDAAGGGGDDDFDLGEFEAEAAGSARGEAASATGQAPDDDAGDQTQIGTPATAAGASTPEEADEGEDFDTMLDLARAYIDMGDPDSAANALEEVAASGNEKQRSEAQSLLESVR